MNLKSLLESRRTGQSGELLKGSDVPNGTKTVTIVVQEMREAPEDFNAPVIIVFEKPVFGKKGWAVNRTNSKQIIKHFGEDTSKLVGKKIKLELISVRNPQTGEIVPSLAVSPKQ
jgi:hypothetical protein